MLTLFSTLKPMVTDQVSLSQRNALFSWREIGVEQVIIIGDDEGAEDLAAGFGFDFIPKVRRSPTGAPILSDLFQKAWAAARYDDCAYVNADIILLDDFMAASSRLAGGKYLAVGQRHNAREIPDLTQCVDWVSTVRERVAVSGMDSSAAADYFFHSKGLWDSLGDLALARFYWDNYLIGKAGRVKDAMVIDATEAVTAVHQFHSLAVWFDHPEARGNAQMMGNHMTGIHHAPWVLTRNLELTRRC